MATAIKKAKYYLSEEVSIAPLAIFRIAFGALMFISITRFILKGWIYSMYILPRMHFPFYGFEWVKPLPPLGMYIVFGLLLLASLGILCGLLYRFSTVLFFILFAYIELIDKTNYLNHYYFISLVAFLMIFIPAAGAFSIDNKIFKRKEIQTIPRFYILTLQLQVFVVYFFAGLAKVNSNWLFDAQPLKTWLPAFSHYAVIGKYLEQHWVAYLFCWFGCLYDLLIGFMLFNRRTVNIAYFFVVVFHLATALFFNIGMFPFIMITLTIIFFREEFHFRLFKVLKRLLHFNKSAQTSFTAKHTLPQAFFVAFSIYFFIQFTLPLRHLLYKGSLFWTEQGYRFSWRVMLMEKAGAAFFTVKDAATGKETIIDNKDYLTCMQEKMMATQPDMMVDFARHLKKEFKNKGYSKPIVNVQSFVTLNGSGSRCFINPATDLCVQSNSFFKNKNWIYSY